MNHKQVGNQPHSVLGVQYTTVLLLIWRVPTRASAISRLSYPDLNFVSTLYGAKYVRIQTVIKYNSFLCQNYLLFPTV